MSGIVSSTVEGSTKDLSFHISLIQLHEDGLSSAIPREYTEAHFMNRASSANPKLDYILSVVNDGRAQDVFQSHGISDLWLPIPRQTLRRLFVYGRKEKAFMVAQEDTIDPKLHIFSRGTSSPTNRFGHTSIDDDGGLIKGLRVLGEGGCGIVQEMSISTELSTTTCIRKSIGRPKQLNA
jgi:hypothetical protein